MLPVWLRKKKATDMSGVSFSREIVPWTVGAMANVYDTLLDTTPLYSLFGNSASQVTGRLQITGPTYFVPQTALIQNTGGTVAEALHLQGLVNSIPSAYSSDLNDE
jgi:hypothetical protein